MAEEEWASDRYALSQAHSPDAPETAGFQNPKGDFGWVHSYETGATVDGPGVRVTLFVSGCLLRCLYCHNPDTWHLKDGTRISYERAERVLASYGAPLRALGGGLTISGGEPLTQVHFTQRLFAAAKPFSHGLGHTGRFWKRMTISSQCRPGAARYQIVDPETYRRVTKQDVSTLVCRTAGSRAPVRTLCWSGSPRRR